MKRVTRVNEKISIFADENQFIIKIRSKQSQRLDKQRTWYAPTLEMCFREIFEYLCRKRLADGKNKSLEEFTETRKEILEIMESFVKLTLNFQ